MKKTKKKKGALLSEKALTLDDVFGQVAETAPTSLTPELTRTVLTPLSAEACLKHGINPEVLRKRDYETFWEPNIDHEVQQMRHKAYVRRREELMCIASEERSRLLSLKNEREQVGGDVPSQIVTQQEKCKTSLVEIEKRRLAKARYRQKKELMQMLQFEAKMDEIQSDMRQKAEREARVEEEKKREKRKQERRAAEERRMRELRRKAQEDAEEELQRIAAQQMHEKEMKVEKDKEQQAMENKARARLLEEERARRQEAHRLQTQHFLEQQQREIEKKIADRQAKEEEREAKAELKKMIEQEENEARKKELAQRLEANRAAAKQREENRKKELLEKQELHERIQQQLFVEQEEEKKEKQKKRELDERKRAYQLRMAREREENMKEGLLQKFQDVDEHIARINKIRSKELLLTKKERELKEELKKDNVERIKRMHEYHRLETMRKVSENDRRTEELKRKKEELINQRRKAAHEAKVQKDKIMSVLEQTKTKGGKSIKKILASLEEDGSSGRRKRKGGKKNAGKSLSRSKSYNCMPRPPIEDIGPPPDAPSLYKRLAKSNTQQGELDPSSEEYRSPYLAELPRTDSSLSDTYTM